MILTTKLLTEKEEQDVARLTARHDPARRTESLRPDLP